MMVDGVEVVGLGGRAFHWTVRYFNSVESVCFRIGWDFGTIVEVSMSDPWADLQSVARERSEIIWFSFAKEGKESAVLAPLSQYPNAAAWLAESMSMENDFIARKLGAMLAGWIQDSGHKDLLSKMLARERQRFVTESMNANSVGEDVLFAATRWTESLDRTIGSAGIDALATMIRDTLAGTPWNTVNWAIANLHRATAGKHEVFEELTSAGESQIGDQKFLRNVIAALKQNDMPMLARMVASPSERSFLSPGDPHYPIILVLWDAVAAAEAAR